MVTEKDVQSIANLARMNLSQKEILPLARDLEHILNYIAQLETLDVSDIQPTSHVLPLKNVYRDDNVQPSFSQDQALSIAVSKFNGAFKVPQIID